jgi:hypothetical protein
MATKPTIDPWVVRLWHENKLKLGTKKYKYTENKPIDMNIFMLYQYLETA